MSELKAHRIDNIVSAYKIGKAFCMKTEEEVYIKSEAGKVIAELEMKLAIAQQVLRLNKPEALYSNLETMSRLTHEKYVIERRERHQKYKRCLAMAMWCRSRSCFYDTMRADSSFWARKSDRAYKWHKRWLELAEHYKEENKCL